MNNPFKWRKFQKETILLCVRWYLRYQLSYRDLKEMMLERGVEVNHTTIYRWVQCYAPQIEAKSRQHIKKSGGSYRIDETYVKVKGKWKYLYRAVDKKGNTIDFYLSSTRDKRAAKIFFKKALGQPHVVNPYVINVDKNPAYARAFSDLKILGILPKRSKLRQVKYLNNIVEADHRFIKSQSRNKQWFRSFTSAENTISGYEIMNMIRKGQVRWVAKGNIVAQNNFIASLFEIAA